MISARSSGAVKIIKLAVAAISSEIKKVPAIQMNVTAHFPRGVDVLTSLRPINVIVFMTSQHAAR